MTTPVKICLFNIGLAVFFGLFFSLFWNSFLVAFGVVAVFGGAFDLLLGFILFLTKYKETAQGFLISSGILLLLGCSTCSLSTI